MQVAVSFFFFFAEKEALLKRRPRGSGGQLSLPLHHVWHEAWSSQVRNSLSQTGEGVSVSDGGQRGRIGGVKKARALQ